jgi:hypothetical protein
MYEQRNMWIGDSGASCHFTNDDTAFIKWRTINDVIGVGDGSIAHASKIGTDRLEVHQKNDKRSIVCLNGCKYVKGLRKNLFSITQALTKGWTLSNNGVKITVSKKHGNEFGQISFDTIDPGTTGVVMMVKMVAKPYDHTHNNKHPQEFALDFRTLRQQPMLMNPNITFGKNMTPIIKTNNHHQDDERQNRNISLFHNIDNKRQKKINFVSSQQQKNNPSLPNSIQRSILNNTNIAK